MKIGLVLFIGIELTIFYIFSFADPHQVIILLGIEFIAFCVIWVIGFRWNQKLRGYLETHYPQFYDSHLKVPVLAGGPDIARKHLRSLKTFYWGTMPDRVSSLYQAKATVYMKAGLLCLCLIAITMVSIPLWGYVLLAK